MKSYAQNGEDLVIAQFWGDHAPGVFIDIGAADGVTFSNSRLFMEREGWSGVFVEADPRNVVKLLDLYGANPACAVVAAAVDRMDTDECLKKFNLDSGEGLYSTSCQENMTKWSAKLSALWLNVGTIPIDEIMRFIPRTADEPMGAQHVVSIDVEGGSGELLYDLMRNHAGRVTPRVICVEHDGEPNALWSYLEPFGYAVLALNRENLIVGRPW